MLDSLEESQRSSVSDNISSFSCAKGSIRALRVIEGDRLGCAKVGGDTFTRPYFRGEGGILSDAKRTDSNN